MATTNPIPQIYDTARRVVRTIIQAGIPAFIGFAAVLPAILGAVKVYVSPELYVWFLATAGGITAVAAALSRVMAIPAVNSFLSAVKLAGHSGNVEAGDTYTRMLAVQQPASSGEAEGGSAAN